MKGIKITSYSSQTSLLSSIIFFIIGAILFTQADAVLSFVSTTLGIISIVIAITQIITIVFEIKREERVQKRYIIAAAFFLFISIIFLFFSNIVEQFIRFIIGAWILFSGIMRFINCLSMNNKSQKFLPLLIISILLMATGVATIVISGIFLKGIGFIMIIYAAIETVGYIFNAKDNLTPEEPGTTTLIVPETETSKDNSRIVKDVKESNIKNRKKSKKEIETEETKTKSKTEKNDKKKTRKKKSTTEKQED